MLELVYALQTFSLDSIVLSSKMNNFVKKQKVLPCGEAGQTLIEVILAFSVSILVLSAVIVGVTTSLSNTQYAKNQNLANSYAQEGMAVVRQIRDSSWNNFKEGLKDVSRTNTIYCLGQNSMELKELNPPATNCWAQSPVGGIFSREIKFDHDSSDCSAGIPLNPTPTPTLIPRGSKVTVRVSWSDSKCPIGNAFCHKVELISCFSDIDQRQAP